MQIIELEGRIESSADCKAALNAQVKKANWKRLYKFECGLGSELRCFKNEFGDVVTIAENSEGENCAFVGINIQDEIKAIREIAKWYWTHDYGEIWYHPEKKALWISGGDGGYCFSKTKVKFDDEEFYDNYDHDKTFVEFNKHPQTAFIQTVEWEAECGPEDEDYMRVGQIQLFE
jgi:hypothetical protein